MVGTLRSVETNGKGCAGGVRAELFDGSDTVTLVWLGQRRIPGIDSGRTLRVHGRLGKLENGAKAIYNPRYGRPSPCAELASPFFCKNLACKCVSPPACKPAIG